MRHVKQRLGNLLKDHVPYLVEHQRQNDWRGEREDDAHEGQYQRISQICKPHTGGEKLLEPVQTKIGAVNGAGIRRIVLKTNDESPHGQVLEYGKVN